MLEHFLSIALMAMEVVSTPDEETEEESYIRDVADRPILRAALNAKVDVLLTGDKEFLESGVVLKKSSIYAISKQNCLSVGNDLATDFLYSMNKILYKHVDILKTKGIDEIRKHAYNNTNRTQHASQRCGPRWVF